MYRRVIVARGDMARILETIEAPFDPIARSVDGIVDRDSHDIR